MSNTNSDIDFSLLLASSVHDMKNSLGMLLSSLAEVIHDYPPENSDQRKRYGLLEGEAFRIKNDLTYLLGLYRLEHSNLPVDIDEVYLDDFLQLQIATNQVLFEMHDLNVKLICDESLVGYFDESLIAGVLNNVLVNGAKYTDKMIEIRACKDGDYLRIQVIDDGQGYPQTMIESQNSSVKGISFRDGSTNLGLHFAAQIAALHKRRDLQGYIQLENIPSGGGCFSLFLP